MKYFIQIIQIILSISITMLILLQAKGVGLGRAWGGGGEFYKSKRGVEKVIFQMTIIFIILFLISSITNLLISG
ncbi:preprotein translocase subunit SecG [Candidatus Gottesmanbacteria bacterium RBG_13_37_7]|uniref:Protein-export membrane protein SecG n=1 Tax=Candidatus Gottesmanbacteria bacterium RBG_13_37_7 TaxID=1798369 RepID=A0A1F5YJZ6_9BACT|nr:MAG: preprotein translocase subunit SecG [Candidatus Gottesmanbacteria bacterium RBG_13_37_7]